MPSTLTIHLSRDPIAHVNPRFLSFAVDIAQVVGGRFWCAEARCDPVPGGGTPIPAYDFNRPRLVHLVRALSPAYLRIGGTASDQVYYDLSEDASAPLPRDTFTA